VDFMLAKMTGLQMQDWEWFFQIEPFGAEVEELRFGQISSTLANIKRSENSKAFCASDFFVTFQKSHKPRSEQTADEMLAVLEGMFGGC
jgi:hypothetical protein